MTKFDKIYQKMIKDIIENGIREKSERTGLETAAIPGMHFSLDIEKDGFPVLTLREIPVKIFVAEQAWFIAGARKPEDFLREYTKIWDYFTNPNDVVTVAYGFRWRRHFGRDQLSKLINLLENEPSSRHGVVMAWDPATDGLSLKKRKNVPCPFTFVVNIIGGRLHLHNIVRSNDMILGFPHDVAGFALLQCVLAQKLGVKVGIYSHSISNAHIYENHYHAAEEIIKRENNHKNININLPDNSFERMEEKNKNVVDDIIKNINDQYKPMPKIKNLKIAL
ncbi:MAG: thymidylate synthase [Candidatus Paceibacterota bacterium]